MGFVSSRIGWCYSTLEKLDRSQPLLIVLNAGRHAAGNAGIVSS